jgi:hypothetical protein
MPPPLYFVPLALLVVLIVTDRPCPGCGRWLRHRLDCPARPVHRV